MCPWGEFEPRSAGVELQKNCPQREHAGHKELMLSVLPVHQLQGPGCCQLGCDQRETVVHCFSECGHLSRLFLLLVRMFSMFGETF